MIDKLLVANRGEIACRVMATAHAKGYRTVAVYSEADADARHVCMADEAVCIGPAPVGQSYLNMSNIMAAAQRTGANAIHPGYGFLSERAAFAEACLRAGIIFVGPPVEAIRVMGDKSASKHRMIEAGVPCIPGYHGEAQDEDRLVAEAERIGYPVMVKASAGGGGRGMRIVHEPRSLPAALRSARSEAQAAFGDGRLLLERAVIGPRHVEIQIFGDMQGHVVHLGERDCSVQRRHQKVVEEAPSPAVDATLRARMGNAAVRAAASIGYVGAGTVEFLLAPDGEFFFLEMNTRLQVEHPVTELVTGLDLVALQLDIAEGKPLPFRQDDVRLHGHAIEVRLYAEDPARDFLPQTGTVEYWSAASGEGVRIDHGLRQGTTVSSFYDPMLAKIIAVGADRNEARRRLIRAVENTRIHGVTTNRSFLTSVLKNPEFAVGAATTAFIPKHYPDGFSEPETPEILYTVAALLAAEQNRAGWSNSSWWNSAVILSGPNGERRLQVKKSKTGWRIEQGGAAATLDIRERTSSNLRIEIDGGVTSFGYYLGSEGRVIDIDLVGSVHRFVDLTFKPAATEDACGKSGVVSAPMNGLVVAVHVEKGQPVRRGDLLVVLEAMKMEHQVLAPINGVIDEVFVSPGGQVAMKASLVLVVEEAQ